MLLVKASKDNLSACVFSNLTNLLLQTILTMEWTHPPNDGHAGDVGWVLRFGAEPLKQELATTLSLFPIILYLIFSDGTWGATNPALPWGWKGGTVDSGVYDNVLADPDPYTWKPTTTPVDPNEYQNEWLGSVQISFICKLWWIFLISVVQVVNIYWRNCWRWFASKPRNNVMRAQLSTSSVCRISELDRSRYIWNLAPEKMKTNAVDIAFWQYSANGSNLWFQEWRSFIPPSSSCSCARIDENIHTPIHLSSALHPYPLCSVQCRLLSFSQHYKYCNSNMK